MHDQNRAKLKLGNQYIIPFKGLKDGNHDFKFSFDQKFFDTHEVLDAQKGDIEARILLTKKPTLLELIVELRGTINIQCDRCLEYFDYKIRYRGELVVKFSEETNSGNDEIWVLHPNEYELDLEQYLFECIGLSLPIQRIHPENKDGSSGCDPEMLKKLENFSGSEKTDSGEIDPRWNELKKLLNDTNLN